MNKVKIRLLHNGSIPHTRWCEPIGWEPSNQLADCEYENGSWWDEHEQAAGLIWFGHPDAYGANEVIEANLDDLRIASCGNCRVLEMVKV